ncbi:unnamed protein product [Effrenium voratum]|nr:unnamed protein product [Effrenium voratum]
MQHATNMIFDKDAEGRVCYVECRIEVFKSRAAAAFKGQFLPAIAPAKGITEDNWGEQWMRLRDNTGLTVSKQSPVMPAPNCDGTATKRAIDTEECKRWILLLLEGLNLEGRRLTSHSCKCTMLSYLSKHGDNWEDRLILGGHAGQYAMAINYSRDAMARPLRILEALLLDIRESRFNPDETRSGRFSKSAASILVKDESENEDAIEVIPEAPEPVEAGHVTTSSGSCEAGEDEKGPGLVVRDFTPPDGFNLVQHSKLKTLHLQQGGHVKMLQCGRRCGPFHTSEVAPSQAEVEAFVRRVIVDEEPAIALVSDVRKLIFEASTYVLAELKMQVSAPEVGEVSRKIPFVEKRARLQEQQARLGGLKIEGNMCPSHALIDAVYGMAVSGAIVYLPPWDQEVAGDNKAKPIIKFENSQLTVVPGDALEPIDVGSELKCLWALQRRGIAFDQAEILSWDVHESWVHKLFNTLSQEVPAGFGRVSLGQVLRADRELFVLMTQEISDPLRQAKVLASQLQPWVQARKRKVPGCANAPRPLRDEFHPDGLPDLTNSELTRVQLANSTYEATTKIAMHAANLGASLSVLPGSRACILEATLGRQQMDFPHSR